MKQNRGKQFERIVKESLEEAEYYVLRLQDSMGGFAGVSNPCDFIAYQWPIMYLVECKAIHGKSINLKSNIRPNQISGMIKANLKMAYTVFSCLVY